MYEAKLIWLYDHRFATFEGVEQTNLILGKAKEVSDIEKSNNNLSIFPRYYLPQKFTASLLGKYHEYKQNWLLVWRDVTNATNERTCVTTVIPRVASSRKLSALGFSSKTNPSVLIGNFNSLVLDYVARQKIGGVSLSYFILRQLPIIPPEAYTPENIEFISSRVLELVYTAWDMQPFAQDMGYEGEPFIWNSERRALLRAELDAYYAKLYELTRDERRC